MDNLHNHVAQKSVLRFWRFPTLEFVSKNIESLLEHKVGEQMKNFVLHPYSLGTFLRDINKYAKYIICIPKKGYKNYYLDINVKHLKLKPS